MLKRRVLSNHMHGNECRKWLQDWRYDVISHDKQNDAKSCGVHVIEVNLVLMFF